MTTRRCHGYFPVVLVGALLNAAGLLLSLGYAQVTTNITSGGLGTTISQAGTTWNITGGTRPENGSNLFHSFGSLNVGAGNTANFCNAAACGAATPLVGIQNILGRVTGNQVSNIFGTIQTTGFGTANLFLMNPAGWIFGPTARLNVTGSFHATTADYIRLNDGSRFSAVPSGTDALLTVAAPAAFGFLTAASDPINVQTGVFNLGTRQFTSLLQVPQGKTISFVGGAINMAPSASEPLPPNSAALPFVLAPGGTVNLVSVASPGEVMLNPIDAGGFAKLGDVTMSGGSVVDGREVLVRSGRLLMTDSALSPGFAAGGFTAGGAPVPPRVPNVLPPDGGLVNIRVSDEVRIEGLTQAQRGGSPLPTVVSAGFVAPGIRTFSGVLSPPFDIIGGEVPSILIDANSLSMRGGQASIRAQRDGPGAPGKIEINADTVTVEGRSSIGALNRLAGPGTPVSVNSRTVSLSGDSTSAFTGIFSQGDFNPNYRMARAPFRSDFTLADSGPITINAIDKLTVVGGAQITSDSFALGASSKITLNVGDALFAGEGALAAQSLLAGTSGSITVNASGQVNVQDGFRVTAATFGSGDAGTISITANGGVNLSGTNSRIQSTTFQAPDTQYSQGFAQQFAAFFGVPVASFNYASLRTRLGVAPAPGDLMQVLAKLNEIRDSAGNPLMAVTDFTPGTGGSVSITAPVLTAKAGALIETSTAWDGNAGQINANVGSLFLNDGASISSTSGRVNLVTRQPAVGPGNAGNINLTASDAISISGARSTISTTTFGNGNAGSISLSANQVDVQSGGSVTSESGGTLAGQFFAGTGNAGEIAVSTPTLAMADSGAISVKTSGAGNAGNISLNIGNFTQLGGARVDSSTLGAGRGGDITVTAGNSASISGPGTGLFSTASGSGVGGSIKIQAGQLIQLGNEGTLSAQSTGTATAIAGDINISTPTFQSQNASVTTGAESADGGNISISTTGSLVHLTDSQITTSVRSGSGTGGNIAIDSQLIVLDNSQVLAQAIGGPGGNINITGDVFLMNSGGRFPTSPEGIVDASSVLSTPGTVNIEATFTNVTGTFAQLPSTPLQATELLRASCAARFAGGKASSLVLAGRDGLPLQPGDLLPSPLYVAGPSSGDNKSTAEETPLRFTLLESKDRFSNKYSLLPNTKCSL
jgi:filamentous hemagglutinin family protein